MERRTFLQMAAAAAAFPHVASSQTNGGSIAGQIAIWAGTRLANQAGSMAVNMALGYLGLEPGEDVDSKLDEMNAKLDQILSQLNVLNAKMDLLASSINQLTNDVDIGLKQAYAQISESALVPVFGQIDTKFGSKENAHDNNLFGLMHLPPQGKSGVANKGDAFKQQKQQFWEKIHSIHYTLTVRAGSSECLLQKWASLVIAKTNARGQGVNLGGYASLYESWFTQAMSYQLKAYAMVLFCTGRNAESVNTARQEMSGLMAEECSKYLDGLDRMVLSLARVAPSGPTTNPLSLVTWANGTAEWLLRGDVYTAMLKAAFDGDTKTPQAKKVSGVYGRIVLRPSDLTADGKAPDRIAFAQYPEMQGYWPRPEQSGLATLGAQTEFQGVDWTVSNTGGGQLKPGAQSALRFGRYFWPTPPRPGQDFRNLEPFGYTYWHWTDRPLQQDSSGVLIGRMRPQGRPGIPTYRSDAKVMLFGLADLAPIQLQRGQTIRFRYANGQPVSVDSSDPYQIFGNTAAFVISWLDGWSVPSNGASFNSGAAVDCQATDYSGDRVLSCPVLTNTMAFPHLLQFDSHEFQRRIQSRMALPAPMIRADVKGTVRCAWSDGAPSQGVHAGRRVQAIPLFSTSPAENGAMQIHVRGHWNVAQTKSADGVAMSCGTKLLLADDKGSAPVTLYIGAGSGDFEINYTTGQPGPPRALLPNANYRLLVEILPTADFKYHYRYFGGGFGMRVADCSKEGGAENQFELTITEAAISRPAGTGYQPA